MKKSQNIEDDAYRRRAKVLPQYMQNKLAVTYFVIMLAFLALIVVIYRLVKNKNEEYNHIVLSQRQASYGSRTIPYRRGDIMDRNGTVLATSQKVYSLILDPKVIYSSKSNDYEKSTIDALVEGMGYDRDEVTAAIQKNRESSYVSYAQELSYDQKAAFQSYIEKKNQEYKKQYLPDRIKGIWFEDNYKRYYPYKSLGCNIIGFSNKQGTDGNGGVEQYYNDTLIGTNGREYGYLNEDVKLQSVIREPSNGNSIVTTMNTNIQSSLEKYLAQWQNDDVGSKIAAAIVMNPKNGEILAMGSTNRFDLNNPRELDPALYPDSYLRELGITEARRAYRRENPDKDPITDEQVPDVYTEKEILAYGRQVAWNSVWRNYIISDTYEPGSTAKPFTIAGALEEAAISPGTTFNCEGYVELNDGYNVWRIKCNRHDGHGVLDATQSLMYSCNVYLMRAAFAEGISNFIKYQHLFGFGEKTGVDLPAEADATGLLYDEDKMGRTDLATNSFGQNFNVSMIQMAAAYCSILNGGSYYRPHVVKQILNPNGTVIEDVRPELLRVTASKSTCDFIKKALFETVEEGTGKLAKIQGYHVGGKTGTAEKLPRKAKNYLVSFCGFAPIEDPQVLVYVVVDTPNLPGEEQATASFATKIEQKIMNDALQFLNVAAQGETDPENSINKLIGSGSEGISSQSMGGSQDEEGEDASAESSEEGDNASTEEESRAFLENIDDEKVDSFDDSYELPEPDSGASQESE